MQPDCIVLNACLPDLDGVEDLTRWRAQAGVSAVPVIVLTGVDAVASSVEAIKQGAQDLLVKADLTPETLCRAVRHAIETATLRRILEAQCRQINALERCVRESTGALTAAHATLRSEVAARQCAEEACRRLEREAQQATHFALLGRLVAGVSHEIRNPLGAIFLAVDLLEEELRQPGPDSPTEIAQALSEIRTQLARLGDLVQEYLSLVRVAGSEPTLQELGAAVQTWAAEMQGFAAARGSTVQCEDMRHLGQVVFHPGTLRRAVLNLVQNALDAMPQGGTVTLTGEAAATHVHLRVQDTGSGIPAAQLEQIFEPLYTTRPGGTGLGLYIVQEIVAAHAGQVTVQSTIGQGTTFTITLPRKTVVSSQG
jgi:signal transduction histidine kinase